MRKFIAYILLLVLAANGSEASTADPNARLPQEVEELLIKGRYQDAKSRLLSGSDTNALLVQAAIGFIESQTIPTDNTFALASKAGDYPIGHFGTIHALINGFGIAIRQDWTPNEIKSLQVKLNTWPNMGPLEHYFYAWTKDYEGVRDNQFQQHLEKAIAGGCAAAYNLRAQVHLRQGNASEAAADLKKAADLGLAEAHRHLCTLYFQGNGVQRDLKKAYIHALMSAEMGDVLGMCNAGVLSAEGKGADPDPKAAAMWIDRAAGSGHWAGLLERGMARINGQYGYTKDEKSGFEEVRKAAETWRANALAKLAELYLRGLGTQKDEQKAVTLYKAAYVNGLVEVSEALYYLYGRGRGNLKKNIDQEMFWMKKFIESRKPPKTELFSEYQKEFEKLEEELKKLNPATVPL